MMLGGSNDCGVLTQNTFAHHAKTHREKNSVVWQRSHAMEAPPRLDVFMVMDVRSNFDIRCQKFVGYNLNTGTAAIV